MSGSLTGLPLLSGQPPEPDAGTPAETCCRKCSKAFNVLFTRGRRCNHCGYTYCHSCSDYQAVMPRNASSSGYDPVSVCAFCIRYLSITAGGKGYLRSQSLAALKNYTQAYNIRLGAGILEKEDVINAIIAARGSNGCLPRANENYYRKNAVPYGQAPRPRNLFSRPDRARTAPRQDIDPRTPWTQPNDFARPDLQPDQPRAEQNSRSQQPERRQSNYQPEYTQNSQYAPPPGPPPYAPYTSTRRPSSSSGQSPSGNQYQHQPQPQPQPQSQPQRNNSTRDDSFQASNSSTPRSRTTSTPNRNTNASSTPRSPSAPVNPSPPPPVPTLNELLAMEEKDIAALSVGSLKAVLDKNHVPARLVLEKSELVARVVALVETERRERARMEVVHEREEWEAQEREWAARERERAARAREREAREREAREQEERETRERQERERKRRRDAYRTTVESASDSDEDIGVPPQAPEPNLDPGSMDPASSAPSAPDTPESAPASARSDSPEPPPRPRPERSGLCVVCQDEDANIVIVDCGHLALCRACADLVWSSSRECPLCRTRIVTESRLLRVFKT
ncbi:hypothetical protein M0805_002102 [Coniferiporia weirii]|nr:hypothetical protein M0805_002102 [Coniferiporia weirii]